MRDTIDTSLGRVRAESAAARVASVHLGARGPTTGPRTALSRDLVRYFSGGAVDFDRYRVDLTAFTEFERAVYGATRRIPAGEVRTYGEIAAAVGNPGASRAVGNALGENPACIVIPCHRVVASGGIGGFTSGLRWKRALLDLEGADTA